MRIRSLVTLLVAATVFMLPCVATAVPNPIHITKFQLPPGLPAPPGAIAALRAGIRIEASAATLSPGTELGLVVRIRQGAALVCGNNLQAALPVRAAASMQFDGADLSPVFAGCRDLAAGAYTICAQFYSLHGDPLSDEACIAFNVAAPAFTAPVNQLPEDSSTLPAESVRSGLRFEWRGVNPAPDGLVTYRLRVWRLPDGSDAAGAIKQSQPVLTRDVNDATGLTLRNALPDVPAPGARIRYVWTVQALDASGNPIGPNAGASQPTVLAITTYAIQLDKIAVACSATPGVYSFSFSLTNPNIGAAKLSAFTVTASVPAGAAVSAFAPPLNTNIPAGSQITVTGTITGSPGLSSVCIGAQITDQVNSFWQASKDTCIPVAACRCDACDPKKVDIRTPAATVTVNANNTVGLAQPLTVVTSPLKLIKGVRAELVYFSFQPDDDDCMPCNRDSRTFGNFLAGNLGSAAGAGAGTHALEWLFAPPKNGTGITPFNTVVSLPPMIRCCDATLKFCIRYVITFSDCTVCSKLACYEKRLDGCAQGVPSANNN